MISSIILIPSKSSYSTSSWIFSATSSLNIFYIEKTLIPYFFYRNLPTISFPEKLNPNRQSLNGIIAI